MTKIHDIKYIDEINYAIEGFSSGDEECSLQMIIKMMQDEHFKAFMKESKYLVQVVYAMANAKTPTRLCSEALHVITEAFNPYSFEDMDALFGILLQILNSSLCNECMHSCIASQVNKIIGIMRRIPIRWYCRYTECIDLEKLIHELQILIGKRVVKWSRFVCLVLSTCCKFTLEDKFIGRMLTRRDYRTLGIYTQSEENVVRLASRDFVMHRLANAVRSEFGNRSRKVISMNDSELCTSTNAVVIIDRIDAHEKASNTSRCENAKRDLLAVMINLACVNICLDIPLKLIEEMHNTTDSTTKCYAAMLLLVSPNFMNELPCIDVESLKQNARRLEYAANCLVSKTHLSRLISLLYKSG
ncbi:hypothetical protein CWI42_021480 [Ordospora colligata]|uniref:Uncharacterized protein n=1 Tax=Ordospora colligata OC4 TaxID=1354746 RepID=A0A0B2UMZ0_9MICR|nr:uncharacterized protein M896_021490 [Ordospora colligata OC4]KHN70310.1 hypothetical protein M896_021490 [Ordospora colligata OC4]TBU16854.1 hypothetical protein CWI41_021500 [Ordospora colligata]TBU16962.1 hypothetical protein CWI40_021500 [Ordospora colligata]TBU19403.1 hypothetical protein CWI42_021480 [Ordospora colligata]